MNVKSFYTSPLGRAKDTAKPTLERLGKTAEVLEWLREFPPKVKKPYDESDCIAWDWLPGEWTKIPEAYDKEKWMDIPCFADANMAEHFKRVTDGLDSLLCKHGYVRQGNYYRAEHPNEDTVVLFCHFGLECVLLAHLLGVSPMILWHGACAAPSSVTILNTEERREGIAYFRMACFGDTSHLYAAEREPSFAARFCETYANKNQRHD
jgi:probable phosphoglycerate mutase